MRMAGEGERWVAREHRAFALALGALALACSQHEGRSPSSALPPQSRVEPVVVELPDSRFDGAIRLASVFPWLGRYSLSGIQSTRGARLAVEDVNRGGGIHGRRLKLLEYRTGSYFVDVLRAADVATSQGEALAIIGSNDSSLSAAIAGLAEARGVVQVSNVSTAQDLTWDPATGADRRYVFRVCVSDVVMGAQLARFAWDDLGARRVAVLYEVGRSYSAKLARSFVESFRDPAAGRLTEELFYLPLETDFRGQIEAVRAFKPDLVFVPGAFTDATLIAIQAEALGVRPTLLGADGWSNPLLFERGGPSRPAFHCDHCFPPPSFAERYRKVFGEDSYGCRAALAYDAVLAVAAALRTLGPLTDEELVSGLAGARERLRQALVAVDVQGVTGAIRFDAHGDVRRGLAIIRIDPGPGGHVSRLYRQLEES